MKNRTSSLRLALALSLSTFLPTGAMSRAWAEGPASEATPGAKAAGASAPAASASSGPGRNADLVQKLGRPWADGVSEDRQTAAQDLLMAGNLFLRDGIFADAVKKYEQALEAWDHPGIHYNIALAYLNLDQPLEVHEHLEKALRFGASPLDADKYEHAQSYLKLVEKQLARLEVHCELYGAEVALDGHRLFTAPGDYKGLVRPGPHTITAIKEGYPTTERTKIFLPGEPTTINLRLYSAGELIEYRRRWPVWKPLAVTGAGAALLVAGALFQVAARDRFDQYDNTIKTRPECQQGCLPDQSLRNLKNTGETFRTLSTVGFIAGGVLFAGGAVLLVLDKSTPYRIDPEQRQAWLSPVVGAGTVGVAGGGIF